MEMTTQAIWPLWKPAGNQVSLTVSSLLLGMFPSKVDFTVTERVSVKSSFCHEGNILPRQPSEAARSTTGFSPPFPTSLFPSVLQNVLLRGERGYFCLCVLLTVITVTANPTAF